LTIGWITVESLEEILSGNTNGGAKAHDGGNGENFSAVILGENKKKKNALIYELIKSRRRKEIMQSGELLLLMIWHNPLGGCKAKLGNEEACAKRVNAFMAGLLMHRVFTPRITPKSLWNLLTTRLFTPEELADPARDKARMLALHEAVCELFLGNDERYRILIIKSTGYRFNRPLGRTNTPDRRT
jgi:hypothetical protein